MESSNYDRTWPLIIWVDCAGDKKSNSIRVRGDYTIGTVMALIGEEIGAVHDWSDYALWWPAKKRWLKQCRMTLDQVDVCANTELQFTSMHKTLRIQFPDLNSQECKVDFSVNVLTAVTKLCQVINISHPEELSFARPLTKDQLKRNNPNLEASPLQRIPYETLSKSHSKNNIYSNGTMNQSNGSLMSNISYSTISSNGSINGSSHSLTSSESRDILLPHPKSSVEKARLNSAWLNSSISLFEQDVCEYDCLLLKFKYYTFYELNSNELTRVNYLYEHLKWSILKEEISCTEDEMYTLAGIMFQVSLCSGMSNSSNNKLSKSVASGRNGNGMFYVNLHTPKSNGVNGTGHQETDSTHNSLNKNARDSSKMNGSISSSDVDEVDCALEILEKQLEGTSLESSNTSNGRSNGKNFTDHKSTIVVPQLTDRLKISWQKIKSGYSTLGRLKLIIGSEKPYFVLFRETTLFAYRPQDYDQALLIPKKEPIFTLNMTVCEVNPDVLASQQKYCFQIVESTIRGSFVYCVKCQNEIQYSKWFTACKQASLGRTMAHASYEEQCQNTLKLLRIQSKFSQNTICTKQELKKLNLVIDPNDFIAPRFLKRKSKEQIIRKIEAAHETFANETLIEAQMNFIRTCQTLKDYAITLFVVRFHKSKKEELLGAMPDKLILIDINTGALKKSWRYRTMINWNINWEVKRMSINFKDETLEFECLSADCKVIHEFIGGYIYMSMRDKENHVFDEEQFLKLTGGWNDEFENEDEHIAMCRREAWANFHHELLVK